MIRRMRPGEPGTDINFQMPTLTGEALPTPQQLSQFLNGLRWLRDVRERLEPINQENRRRLLSTHITRFNRTGWARDRYNNDEQWEARAGTLVDLELQMRRCAELILLLRRRFPNFPLDGLVGGTPPFPGQIEIRNGRIHRIVPDLPDTLELTLENRQRIERCRAWLRHHGERVDRQLARLFAATENPANIFMLGDIEPPPGHPRVINGHAFNLVSFDFEVVRSGNSYRVTPITRYRQSPWYNYLNRIVDGTVHEESGDTQVLSADELVLVNRSGSFELMTVANLESWRRSHVFWGGVRDAVTVGIDLSMIIMGGVEMKAAWTATGQLALQAGRGAARRYMLQTLALRRGGMHLLLGGSGILSSSYFSDPDVHFLGISGEHWRTARHYAFLADAGLQLVGQPGLGSIGFSKQVTQRMEQVIANSWWLRNLEHVAELDLLRYVPIPYLRFAAPYRLASPPLGFVRLSTGRFAMPGLVVGMTTASIIGMFHARGSRDTVELRQFVETAPRRAFIEHSLPNLLQNADLSPTQIGRLLGIMRDKRAPRRVADLIAEFNRVGATEKERLAAATLLLIEAATSSEDGAIPTHLGQGGNRITSQSVKDYILGLFRNGQNPEIRLQAAQALLVTNGITPQEFTTFCMTIARSTTAPKSVRMQAIIGVSTSMIMAGTSEAELARLVQSGEATAADITQYLSDNFGVTRSDLESFLRSIATNRQQDRDLRALSAAILHATNNRLPFTEAMMHLQAVANNWRRAAHQPGGSFASSTMAELALDLSLPVSSGDPEGSQNARRVFAAATTLQLLSDVPFTPIPEVPRCGLALTLNRDSEYFGTVQPLVALVQTTTVSPAVLNDALIRCVNPADPEIAIQALRQLLPRIGVLTPQQIALGMVRLTPAQLNRLREAARHLLARFTLPNQGYQGATLNTGMLDVLGHLMGGPGVGTGINNILTLDAGQQQLTRTRCRLQLIEMLPELFMTAADTVRNGMIRQLGATLRPQAAMLATDTPELRRAAAIAMGRLLEGRPVARSYVGTQINLVKPDVLSLMMQGPVSPSNLLNQNAILSDPSPIARLEAALTDESAPMVRIAALEALLRTHPATLSNGRTLQQLCTDLLETETDPAVLDLLRNAEFLERAPDPTSPDYRDEFQRARYDLILSLNYRGDRSLAGIPQFIFQHCSTTGRLSAIPNFNGDVHSLNPTALRTLATGNGPHSTNALKALAYIIISNGRPFESVVGQSAALLSSVNILCELCRTANPATNIQKARDLLWVLELCLVLQPNLSPLYRAELLDSYMRLVRHMPADQALRQRAGCVAAIVLQREFVSWHTNRVGSNDLQLLCLRYLRTHRTRASLPVLELIARTNRNGPIRTQASQMLSRLRNDPQIMRPGTAGGAHLGQVAFDDVYEHLQRQLIDRVNGLFVPPVILNPMWVRDADLEIPECTAEQRTLLTSFANGGWFQHENARFAPHMQFIWGNADNLPAVGGQRDPNLGFTRLLDLARSDVSTAPPGPERTAELRVRREARVALAWIVAVNGAGLQPSRRDDFVQRAAACLAEISTSSLSGLANLDSVLESALVGQPLLSRQVRNHLITALWNRRQSNGGSISNSHVAIILAGALRSEFQTMPRPGEPEFEASRDMQIRILGLLQQLRHRTCAPVVEALAMHHPIAGVRTRAEETLVALHDNVWRVWNATAVDSTTAPALRATALRNALAGNGAHDALVQAIFNAYRGRPIVAGDPRYSVYVGALSDRRDFVRLATALVVLRSENTAFSPADRRRAMTIAANAALHGVHIGLRQSARQILLDNLPNGTTTVEPVPGRSITITRNVSGLNLVESTNGRITSALLTGGGIRRFFYDTDHRLSRYVSEDNTEYTVIHRDGSQRIWSNGSAFRFVSQGDVITASDAIQHGIRFRISRITYPDGTYREFTFDGNTLTRVRDCNGAVYNRVRTGGTYVDIWTINGNAANTWVGSIELTNDGIYRRYYPHLGSECTINLDGTTSWSRSARTFNLGGGRQLIVQADGRVVARVNGNFADVTISLGEGRELRQFDHGGSVLRESSRPILVSYPPGSNPPVRRFEYRSGHLSRLIFQRTGQAAPTISTRQFTDGGQPTNNWQVAGPTFNQTVTGTLTITNGDYLWVGTNGWQEFQNLHTGESGGYNTR
jgi:hypothetical protein